MIMKKTPPIRAQKCLFPSASITLNTESPISPSYFTKFELQRERLENQKKHLEMQKQQMEITYQVAGRTEKVLG